MGEFWPRARLTTGHLWLATALCLSAGAAFAQSSPVPITNYVVVQPIDVCSNTGTGCAPFNTKTATGNPTNTNQITNPIGFTVNPATGAVNPTTGGVNVTRALLNQIGVDVTFNNIVQYNSALKPDSTTYQTLNVVQTTNNAGATIFQSQDFLTLSQQNAISQTGMVPNPTSPAGVPVSSTPSVINMFFVNKLNPPASQAGGQLYDFSWVNNNGTSVGGNTFFPPFPLTPRTTLLAHAILHNLGLDHMTYGAGPYEPESATNPFPPGGIVPPLPPNPIVGECDAGYPACMANLMTTGSLRTEPTVACVLATSPLPAGCSGKPTLANGMAGQLTTEAQQNPSLLPVSQQDVVVDPSGFLQPIANSATTVSVSPASKSMTVTVTGASNGRPNATLLAWVLVLPPGLQFNNQFRVTSQSRQNLLQDADFPFADQDNTAGAVYDLGNLYGPCTASGAQCLILEFNLPGAGVTNGKTDKITFTKGFSTAVSNVQLCGADVSLIFNDGFMTTSALGPCPAGSAPATLTANSQTPDLTAPVPPQIVNQAAFAAAAANNLPCTGGNPTTRQCPSDPVQTGIADGDASAEGGQICYSFGVPIQCP